MKKRCTLPRQARAPRAVGYRLMLLAVAALLSALPFAASPASAQEPASDISHVVRAEMLTAENWDQMVPAGKEVDAIYGDIVLQNQHVRAVIAQPLASRNANMTVRNVGGCLLDLTTRQYESDQLSAFYPARRKHVFTDVAVKVSSTSETHERNGKIVSKTVSSGSVTVSAPGSDTQPSLSVTYSLTQDSPGLNVASTWTNTTPSDLQLTLEDDLRVDGGNEDMVKAPNGVYEQFRIQDIHWQQAYGISSEGYQLRCNGNSRETVIVYEPADGREIVLRPGQSFILNRTVLVGRDLPEVMALHDQSRKRPLTTAVLKITDAAGNPIPDARISIACGEQNRGVLRSGADGTVTALMPERNVTVTVSVAGTEYLKESLRLPDSPSEAHGKPGTTGESAPEFTSIRLEKYSPGAVSIRITDGDGSAIPAKVEFVGTGGTSTPNWGPDSGEFFVKNLAYTPDGRISQTLQAGQYDVTISHGPEYDAVFTKLNVMAGENTPLNATLERVVRTDGWISADFHSHSSPSGDNTGSQLGRVLNLAAEHIEFAPCTEHNRVSTYDHHIAALGLTQFLATVSGMELTGQPLPLNHQNSFPLVYRPRTQDGGGPSPDGSPETQIERLAAWDNNSRKLIQQNHPDIGWLFFDRNGDQTPDEGYSRSFQHMDVMEIHPIDRILDRSRFDERDGKTFGNNRMLNWLQLLNLGHRIYGVVHTDAHYNFHGSGGLRIWIQSSSDNPNRIDPTEMMVASEEGRIIMSNGPYLEVTVKESGSSKPVVAGQDLTAASGQVQAHVRVQTPNWMDVDTVFVLVNGRTVPELTFTRQDNPDAFQDGVVNFDRTLNITLREDSHLVFVTGHRTELLGSVMGPSWGNQHPAALSNPIFVDVNGGGFTPNKDSLGHPLPVRFVAP